MLDSNVAAARNADDRGFSAGRGQDMHTRAVLDDVVRISNPGGAVRSGARDYEGVFPVDPPMVNHFGAGYNGLYLTQER